MVLKQYVNMIFINRYPFIFMIASFRILLTSQENIYINLNLSFFSKNTKQHINEYFFIE
jgi:hypothetical protein